MAVFLQLLMSPWLIILMKNFAKSVPYEITESGKIDGAGDFKIFVSLIFPMLKPALATVGLFCIVSHWNDWFSGMIYMNNPDNYPLQTYLQSLLQNFEQILQQQGAGDIQRLLVQMNARTGRAAQLFLGALPVMMIYPFLQKYFTKGLVMGSVKG